MSTLEQGSDEAEHHDDLQVHKEVLPRRLIVRVLLSVAIVTVVLSLATTALLRFEVSILGPIAQDISVPPHQVANVRQQPFRIPYPATPAAEVQRRWLSQYHWVDQEAQVVAIPIERAMDLAVKQIATAGEQRRGPQP